LTQSMMKLPQQVRGEEVMSDSLATYLHDHLAGSNFAVELLEFLRDQHAGEPVGAFAATMLAEVEEDRRVLQGLIDRAGKGASIVKEAAAWLGEKLSELKLSGSPLGTFEALEALALGILGKLALWRALELIADSDARVSGLDFRQLAERAQGQHSRVEERRLQAARDALAPTMAR
jgi:hypothetical protein